MFIQDIYAEIVQSHLSLPFHLCAARYVLNPSGHFTGGSSHGEINFCLRGKGLLRINNESEFVIQANQMVIVMPNTKYEYQPLEDMWEIATVRFACNLTIFLQFGLKMNKLLIVNSSNRLLTLIDLLCRAEENYKDRTLNTSSEIIYSLLAEVKLQTMSLQISTNNPKAIIEKVVNFIYVHYSSKLTLDEISRMFGYTPQHLNKLFKNELGHSIYQFILKVQLEQAANLLEYEEMTVEQVADHVGMESRSFYRLFHRAYRVSPGEFRKLARKSI
ncbi:AraC family transcriptional regulator [Paenibacillus sp. P36]|uniref:AraC family transcriptional regulator n=1 Tax=Paenibacillus sp. P36 TaxID=3342538 RepID=UPI0038B2E022